MRNKTSAPLASPRAGFGLIDMLAALAVTAALATALLPFAASILSRWTRAPDIAEKGDHFLQAAARLQDDFLQALPLTDADGAPLLRAGALCVEFVRPALDPRRAGLERVRYAIKRGAGGDLLTRTSALLHIGENFDAPWPAAEPLLEGPWRLQFAAPRREDHAPGLILPAQAQLLLARPDGGAVLRRLTFPLPARAVLTAGKLAGGGETPPAAVACAK
jgi:hypothetical protein